MTCNIAGPLTPEAYTYDAENRITGAAGYTYTYDADGNRVEKSNGSAGTIYWYMSPGIVAESDLAGALKSEYVFFDGKRVARHDLPAKTVSYYFSDSLKTASVVTDSGGKILAESDYYPWGGELQFANIDSNHYKFTGKERDGETGLDYFGARYYGSWIGRFLTPDWAAKAAAVPYAELADPQSLNLFSYVRNRTTVMADADGHEMEGSSQPEGTPAQKYPDLSTGIDARLPYQAGLWLFQSGTAPEVPEDDWERDRVGEKTPEEEAAEHPLRRVEPEKLEEDEFDWTKPGPLPNDIAATFAGGRYTKVVVGEEGFTGRAVYRVYGGKSGVEGRNGTFYTPIPQVGGIQSMIDLGLRPEWGNTAENTVCVELKPGTVMYIGNAASQGGFWVGGTPQIYVPKVGQ